MSKENEAPKPFTKEEIELAMNFAIQNHIEPLVKKIRPGMSYANIVVQTNVLARKVAERIMSADPDEQLY